jgi:hypothetical protein
MTTVLRKQSRGSKKKAPCEEEETHLEKMPRWKKKESLEQCTHKTRYMEGGS